MRFSPGTSGIPFGTAHDTATPSRSRRRSQCRRVALCSWTTKRAPASAPPSPEAGSGEALKSRLRRYSFSWSGVFLDFFVGVAIGGAVRLVLPLLREPVERRRVLAVLRVLDQQVFGLLEAFRFTAAGLVDCLPGRIVVPVFVCLHAHRLPQSFRARTPRSQETNASMPEGSYRALRPSRDRSSRSRARRRCSAQPSRPSARPPRRGGRNAP